MSEDQETPSLAGSTSHMVGVTPKRKRKWQQLFKETSSFEKKLLVAVIVLSVIGLSLLISLIIIASKGQKYLCSSPECVTSAAMLLNSMDTSVSPCEDFYAFTCGKWAESHPNLKESWFTDRTRYIASKMAGVLSENATTEDPLPLVYAKSLYSSCVDEEKLNELGTTPLLDVLEQAGLPRKIPDSSTSATFSIAGTLGKIQRAMSMDILVQISLSFDSATNRTAMVVAPAPGQSSLPELISREEHVSVSPREAIGLRLAYMTGVMTQLEPSANTTELGATALKILVIDSQTRADIQKSETDERPSKMTFNELQELMDNVNSTGPPSMRWDWAEFLTVLMDGLDKSISMNDTVFVDGKDYFVLLATRLHKSKPESYQRYLWWNLVTAMVPHSSFDLRTLKDELYEALFRRPRLPRSRQCAKFVKSFFDMAISYRFARQDNMKTTSKQVKRMLDDISHSFSELVMSLPWMDAKTKQKSIEKAKAVKSYIGYPEWLLQPGQLETLFKGVEVIEGQFLQSMVGIKSAEVKEILKTIGEKPPNNSLGWVADPLEVNAFYGRSSNAIAIPAGILQAPFYFLGLEAMNYGAIGAILGHELTHAFDVEGKDYDATGRKVSWWDESMLQEYDSRAQCFVNQYDSFGFTKTDKINGTLTLAENIADNGGVREAFHAYKYYFLPRNGPEPNLPGMEKFTHEQLFFLAFANVWCEKSTPESDILSLQDVHSPNKFRVVGTLRNLREFSDVWNCPVGSKMNPRRKCVLW